VSEERPTARGVRSEPREIQELRQVKASQPDLASAVDLQIELLKLQRRVQSRVPLPSLDLDESRLARHLTEVPLNWSDLRFMVRETAAILRRFDALEDRLHRRIETLSREANELEPVIVRWYNATAFPGEPQAPGGPSFEGFEEVLALSMRPFLTRCAEVLARTQLVNWMRGSCPACGAEPDFAVITPAADRLLICGRCTMRWKFDPLACPFCRNDDRARISSFASRDGMYRMYACDACKRYLKAYDARNAPRNVMVAVDTVATLPLDAAAIQRGYSA
jgi:formate dehydrogenase maturation protein FdhE